MKLLLNALTKFSAGLALVGMLLFIPAGGVDYTNGWLFIVLLFVPMLILGAFMLVKSPRLLEKRLNAKEKAMSQKSVVGLSAIMFVVGFVVAGLDYRFGWSSVPTWLIIAASFLLLASYGLYAEVMRENAFLSRTIEIQENQTVVDTGLYSIVRHPMYSATIILFLSIPVILGSWWSLICFLPYIALIIIRIKDEEKLLETQLNGYSDYKKRVKYKLFPYVF